MDSHETRWTKWVGEIAKGLVLWSMLISGIVLATRQARADLKVSPAELRSLQMFKSV